jgi:type IV secretory pathway VirB2 component (pilin)
VFGELDRNIPAALEHFMAERAHARRTWRMPHTGGSPSANLGVRLATTPPASGPTRAEGGSMAVTTAPAVAVPATAPATAPATDPFRKTVDNAIESQIGKIVAAVVVPLVLPLGTSLAYGLQNWFGINLTGATLAGYLAAIAAGIAITGYKWLENRGSWERTVLQLAHAYETGQGSVPPPVALPPGR